MQCALRSQTLWVVASVLFSIVLANGPEETGEPLTRIAFGSCNMHDAAQPLWDPIHAFQPQLWIWLGDVVYADTRWGLFDWRPSPVELMQQKYHSQNQVPGYQKLKNSCPVIGIWDDHDFGKNNGGNEYENRSQSQQLFLDFMGAPPDSPLRSRPGIYTSYEFGPPGRRAKVILLDLRYFRDPVPTGRFGGDFLAPFSLFRSTSSSLKSGQTSHWLAIAFSVCFVKLRPTTPSS